MARNFLQMFQKMFSLAGRKHKSQQVHCKDVQVIHLNGPTVPGTSVSLTFRSRAQQHGWLSTKHILETFYPQRLYTRLIPWSPGITAGMGNKISSLCGIQSLPGRQTSSKKSVVRLEHMERINHCYGLDPGIWKFPSLRNWKLLKDAQDSAKPRRGMRHRSSEMVKEDNSFYYSYCSLCTCCS